MLFAVLFVAAILWLTAQANASGFSDTLSTGGSGGGSSDVGGGSPTGNDVLGSQGQDPGQQVSFLDSALADFQGAVQGFATSAPGGSGAGGSDATSQAILSSAASLSGEQCASEGCAKAVTQVFNNAGLASLLPSGNVNWVPNWDPSWTGQGSKVTDPSALSPGDLVVYNWTPGTAPSAPQDITPTGGTGYDHIGVYAGNGQAYNVSTAAGHKFVPTPLPLSNFQFGVHF